MPFSTPNARSEPKIVSRARSDGRPKSTEPLIDVSTIPKLLARLSSEDTSLPAITFYRTGERRKSLTYQRLLKVSERARVLLSQEIGISRGDRVALLHGNDPEYVMASLALLSAGAIVVPLNPSESLEVNKFILGHSGARLLLHSAELQVLAERLCMSLSVVVYPTAGLMREPDAGNESHWPIPPNHDLAPSSPAVMLYTSGTTGRPKGVLLSHYNLLVNAEALRRVHRLDINRTHMCVLPLFHANAWGFSMMASLYSGNHIVLNDTFNPLAFWDTLKCERVNICSAVPSILAILCKRPWRSQDLPELRYLVCAAAPLPMQLAVDFHRLTGIRVHQGYGLSECTNFATTIPYDTSAATYEEVMHKGDVPSAGTPVYGCEVFIIDEFGRRRRDGIHGQIAVRGHNVMLGYWDDARATNEVLGRGYLQTGDIGYVRRIGHDRYLFITGRSKEIIIRSGQNISPAEVERELAPLVPLCEFVVLGFAQAELGEEVGMYIHQEQVLPPALRDRILHEVQRVPFFRRPKVIIYGKGPISKTSTGKVRRAMLRDHFAPFRHQIFREGRPLQVDDGIQHAGDPRIDDQ